MTAEAGGTEHDVSFVIRLKDHWKPKVDDIARGQVSQTFFPGTDLDALLAQDILMRDGRASDADVHVGGAKHPLPLRLIGVHTPKGYGFFLTNLPPRLGPRQVADLYRVRWDKIAALLTHSGKDPNWRRRPSVLDQLRGWKRQPVVRRQSSQHHLKAVA